MKSSRAFHKLLPLLVLLGVGGSIRAQEPPEPSPRVREAIRLATDGDYSGALARLSALLTEEPENPQLLYYVGLCHYFKGEAKEAARYLQKSVEAKPKFPEAYYWAAQALRSIGRPGDAERCVRLGVERFPDNKKLRQLSQNGSQ